jgi:pentatricopeptide repeat protein
MLAAGSPTKDLKVAAAASLKVCKRAQRLDLALALLARMEESTHNTAGSANGSSSSSTLAPDAMHYTEAIVACGPGGEWQHALALFARLESGGGGGGGRLPRAGPPNFSVARAASAPPEATRASADVVACSALLSVLARSGKVADALQLVRRMPRQLGLPPDLRCFNAALAACAESKRHAEDAVELLLVSAST